MAIDYDAEIEALRLAYASGARSVSYDGKSVTYDDSDKLLARLRYLEGLKNGGTNNRPTAGFATFSRGDC
jgi:hypothetical protein